MERTNVAGLVYCWKCSSEHQVWLQPNGKAYFLCTSRHRWMELNKATQLKLAFVYD
uniref:Uncharacterized protein n=1 Tax=viral metagenome TaxID=1070528 RepID=A0A6H1ZIV8_9ZZZZ